MKRISASDAKNNFGGLLEDVAALGAVEIIRHSRPVAILLSPRSYAELLKQKNGSTQTAAWGATHMIPEELARAATMVREPGGFDEE